MCGVPRLWESLAKGVIRSMKKAGGFKYEIFKFFIAGGTKYAWAKDRVTGRVCHFSTYPRFYDFVIGIMPFIFLWPVHKLGNVLVYNKFK